MIFKIFVKFHSHCKFFYSIGSIGDFNVYSRPNLNWVSGPKTWVWVRTGIGPELDNMYFLQNPSGPWDLGPRHSVAADWTVLIVVTMRRMVIMMKLTFCWLTTDLSPAGPGRESCQCLNLGQPPLDMEIIHNLNCYQTSTLYS